MGKRLGFAGDAFMTLIALVTLVSIFALFMWALAYSYHKERSTCTSTGGTWTVQNRQYVCVRPTPSRTP